VFKRWVRFGLLSLQQAVPGATVLTGERITGPGRRHQTHGFDTLPLPAGLGSVVPSVAARRRPA
jgi:hypothetical protein